MASSAHSFFNQLSWRAIPRQRVLLLLAVASGWLSLTPGTTRAADSVRPLVLPPGTQTPAWFDRMTPEEKAAFGKLAATFTENSIGMKFAPVDEVKFCLWPTRVKDYEVFAQETGLRSNLWRSPGFKQEPSHPVVNVSWNDAMAFCRWLTDREHKNQHLPAGSSYRLPTDLEWSNAVGLPPEHSATPEARDMGFAGLFPWGMKWPPPPNVGNYTGDETGSDVAIKGYNDGFPWTSPIGSFAPNKYGLFDVGGNVWQWCMDFWSFESKAHVLRGASWYNGALKLSLLSSCRVHANADSSTDNYGFRVVIAADTPTAERPR